MMGWRRAGWQEAGYPSDRLIVSLSKKSMRLFDFERSPNPRRVRIFIAEKNLDIPRIPVNLYRHEQLSPGFLAINPAGTVPVLELDDGTRLTEGIAICRYLDRLHPEPPLFGTTPQQEALTLMWANIVENDGLVPVNDVLRNLSPGFRNHAVPGPVPHAQLPELIGRSRIRAEHFFDRMEAQLKQNEYLAGGSCSFADISLLVTVDYASWVEIVPTRTRPALARWHQRMAARPSAGA
jgi:glutathione S-transferase